MPSKHNAGGCKCCNPPCAVSECNCKDGDGKNRCFPVFQFKFDNLDYGTIAGNDYGCSHCKDLNNDLFQYDCEVDSLARTGQPYGITGENGLWFEAYNNAGDWGSIDPCTGLTIVVKTWVKLVQSGTTTTITTQIEATGSSGNSYRRFTKSFTVASGDCPDNSDKSSQTMTVSATGTDTDPCNYSAANGYFQWV